MFQHLSRLNHQNTQLQSQSGPYHSFYHNFPLPPFTNNWLRWDCLSWPQNHINFPLNPVSICKIEQSESIRHVIPQNIQNEVGMFQFRQKQTKQELHQKSQDKDSVISAQKKAICLARKQHLSQQEKNELKRYRQMRVEGYRVKKVKRTFEKKIVYTTRKRVADRRIRYKGKFINEYQARQLLGLSGREHSFQELKAMMKHFKNES